MSDHPRSARGARGLTLASATVLGLLLLAPYALRGARDARSAAPEPRVDEARATPIAELGARRPAAAPAIESARDTGPPDPRPAVDRAGERELHALRAAEARRDLPGLERAAPAIVLGSGPLPDRVAVLRALEDAGSGDVVHLLRRAAVESEDDALASFALRRLAARASGDREARAALRVAAFGPAKDASLRMRAAQALALEATEAELLAAAGDVAGERDPLVRQAFHVGLRTRQDVGVDVLAALRVDGDSP